MEPTLGLRLRQLRKERKLFQTDVAAAVDIERPTLSAIETGKDMPGRDLLGRLADFYGVAVDELYRSPSAPTSPKVGERTKDKDEAALLGFWRKLDEPEKRLFLIALARARDVG